MSFARLSIPGNVLRGFRALGRIDSRLIPWIFDVKLLIVAFLVIEGPLAYAAFLCASLALSAALWHLPEQKRVLWCAFQNVAVQ
jgi:hypothetical protein